jgi:predicted neuraminidase
MIGHFDLRWSVRMRLCLNLAVYLVIWGPIFGGTVRAGEPATEWVSLSPLNAANVSAIVDSEFLYEKAPFPEVHASTIEETSAGLVCSFFGGTEESNNDVGIWVTRQVGKVWTPPVEVANGIQHKTLRHPCWNPVLYQQPEGPLQLYYKCGPSPSTWWGMLTESTDCGVTWSRPVRLPESIDGPVKNKPVRLKDGSLLCGCSTEHNDQWVVHFEITRDQGHSWERIGPVHSPQEFGAIQPTILTLKDGTLEALSRSRQGCITRVTSSDNGHTWTPMVRTQLPNPNSGIDAVTLTSGQHLLVYNHTQRNVGTPRSRGLLNVAISDDGENWKAALVLENSPFEYSYPAVIQTKDGLVHVLYTWRRQRVRHVVIDPTKLTSEPIRDGIWPGLPQAGRE